MSLPLPALVRVCVITGVGQTLYGYAQLTDADHLEYSFDDGPVATYRRADGAPGCA